MFSLSISSLLLDGIAGYLIGSIPFAYLITKSKTGMDIRQHGSHSVGTMNSYEVTGQKSIGSLVFAGDFLKGLIPVLLFEILGLHDALLILLPSLVLGHCYPVWLRFHGGRGLATAAGAVLVVNPLFVLIWVAGFVVFWKIRHDIHVAAIVTSLICLGVVLLSPAQTIEMGTLAFSGLSQEPHPLSISIGALLLIILTRHVGPFMDLVRARG